MMSFKTWLIILLIYTVYLLLGGAMFWWLEYPEDCRNKEDARNLGRDIRKQIRNLTGSMSEGERQIMEEVLSKVDFAMNKSSGPGFTSLKLGQAAASADFGGLRAGEEELEEPPDCFTWNYYNSVFFSFTAVTTIGYGHLSPATDEGKAVCIVYSLFGVPLNGILVGGLASFFSAGIEAAIDKVKGGTKESRHRKRKNKTDLERFGSAVRDWVLYLIPGTIVLLCLPAVVFVYTEDWDYLDAFYFTFITLTTIGFGDLVAGRYEETLDDLGNWKVVYQIALFVWIIIGLGYVFMIVGVIADNLKKPAKSAVKRFKRGREKAMTRRILQEIVVMKTKASELPADALLPPRTRTGSEPCLRTALEEDEEEAQSAGLRRSCSSGEISSSSPRSSPPLDLAAIAAAAATSASRSAAEVAVEEAARANGDRRGSGSGDVFSTQKLMGTIMSGYYAGKERDAERDSRETTTDFEDESDGEEGGEDTSNTTEEEELNHDTITSLRGLMLKSRAFASSHHHHPTWTGAETSSRGRQSLFAAVPNGGTRFHQLDELSPAAHTTPLAHFQVASASTSGRTTPAQQQQQELLRGLSHPASTSASLQHSRSDLRTSAAATTAATAAPTAASSVSRWAIVRRKLVSEPRLDSSLEPLGVSHRRKLSLGGGGGADVQYQPLGASRFAPSSATSSLSSASSTGATNRRQHRSSNLSMPEILRSTTLEEFIVATEKVMREQKREEEEEAMQREAHAREEASAATGLAGRIRKISSPAAFNSILSRGTAAATAAPSSHQQQRQQSERVP